jgi:hypothetical protein
MKDEIIKKYVRDLDGLLEELRMLRGKLLDIEAERIYNVEDSVIFTFGMVFRFFDFSAITFGSRKGIDAFVEWYNKYLGLEFETCSSNFHRHNHPEKSCHLIVCWKDDDAPEDIEVIELKQFWQEAQEPGRH